MRSFTRKIIQFVILAIASVAVTILVFFLIKKHFNRSNEPTSQSSHSVKIPIKNSLAGSYEIPYHVTIFIMIQNPPKYECSGSLIHKKYVLTFATCVIDYVQQDDYTRVMKVFVGTRTLPGGSPYDVEKITYSPLYDHKKFTNDIAVIQLKEEVKKYRPISLPDKTTTFSENLELLVSGYGSIATTPYTLSDQHRFTMKVVSNETCQKYYARWNWDFYGKFCAIPVPGYETCLGDVGSPATDANKAYLIAMYATSNFCGKDPPEPELFVDVSIHLKFIRSAMA